MRRTMLAVLALTAATASAQDGVFGSTLHPIRPCRILDTRVTVEGTTMIHASIARGPLRDGETRRYLVMCGSTCYDDVSRRPVPLGATGLHVTVIAVGATGVGHLQVYDSTLDDPLSTNYRGVPLFSTLNFQKGAAISTTTFVELGQDQGYQVGQPILPDLAIRAHVTGGGTVHVVLDVVGYYAPASMPVQP